MRRLWKARNEKKARAYLMEPISEFTYSDQEKNNQAREALTNLLTRIDFVRKKGWVQPAMITSHAYLVPLYRVKLALEQQNYVLACCESADVLLECVAVQVLNNLYCTITSSMQGGIASAVPEQP